MIICSFMKEKNYIIKILYMRYKNVDIEMYQSTKEVSFTFEWYSEMIYHFWRMIFEEQRDGGFKPTNVISYYHDSP